MLDYLPQGFLGVPWFQLKKILTKKEGSKEKPKKVAKKVNLNPKTIFKKEAKQDIKFLNELARDKFFLQVIKTTLGLQI